MGNSESNGSQRVNEKLVEALRFLASEARSAEAEGRRTFTIYLYRKEDLVRIVAGSTGESVSMPEPRLKGPDGAMYFAHWFKYNLGIPLKSIGLVIDERGEYEDIDPKKSYFEYRLSF
ncbi:MAG: hypothetical protein AAB467_03250 [Patescibacteria group bacterium]